MLFLNREDAADQLFPWLEKYSTNIAIVLAIPRGGVVIGYYLVKKLHFELELLFAKKIGHPLSAELAIGAVSLHDHIIDPEFNVSESYIHQQIIKTRKSLVEKNKKFLGNNYNPADLKNKTVILVDDGIATGNTILAGIRLVKKTTPAKIVVAVPVCAADASVKIQQEADEFICLHVATHFYGVGQFYHDFSEVEDRVVMKLLNDLKDRKSHEY